MLFDYNDWISATFQEADRIKDINERILYLYNQLEDFNRNNDSADAEGIIKQINQRIEKLKFELSIPKQTHPPGGQQNKLTIPEIALKCVYEGVSVTQSNANQIVSRYGYSSGHKLYLEFNWHFKTANRTAMPDRNTKKTLENKISYFEKVIETLPKDKIERAKSELSILQSLRAEFEK